MIKSYTNVTGTIEQKAKSRKSEALSRQTGRYKLCLNFL